jgi:hypothetical protein
MRALAILVVLGGCGGGQVVSAEMALAGLQPANVGSAEVLVLGGPLATCARALEPPSPLDDPELDVVRHALFAVDGTPKHLTAIPAGERLCFYAETYQSTDGSGPRNGRGCAEAALAAGQSSGVSITITASN